MQKAKTQKFRKAKAAGAKGLRVVGSEQARTLQRFPVDDVFVGLIGNSAIEPFLRQVLWMLWQWRRIARLPLLICMLKISGNLD